MRFEVSSAAVAEEKAEAPGAEGAYFVRGDEMDRSSRRYSGVGVLSEIVNLAATPKR